MSKTNTVLAIPEPGKVELLERPYPKIVSGYALVKVAIAPVCIEHQVYKEHLFEAFEDGHNLGHEGVGEVIEVAPGSGFEVGDRVIMYPHHGCRTCPVCRNGLSPTHCMNIPYEHMEDYSNPEETLDALGGDKLINMKGSGKGIEKVCGSESGGFGFSKYRIAPEWMMTKMPDDLSYRHAALGNCTLGVTYTGAEETEVKPGDWVLVAGVGFIGFGAIINAKYRGAKVIALGRNEYRMELAQKLGADHIVRSDDPDWLVKVRDLTGDYQGCDVAFECSGYPYYQKRALQGLRRYGRLFLYGFQPHNPEPYPMDFLNEVQNRHIFLTGGHDTRIKDRDGLVRMLNTPLVKEMADLLITHEYNMSQGAEAFETCLTKKAGKVFLYPQEDCPNPGPTAA